GSGQVTDFLAVSLSSPDYVGHRFGPNSIEVEDTYLRLDADLGAFLKYLDKQVGKGNYTLFLTADHGVAHVPGFMLENKLPAGSWDNDFMIGDLNKKLKEKFAVEKLVLAETNYQVYLNHTAIDSNQLDKWQVEEYVINYLNMVKGVGNAFRLRQMQQENLPNGLKEMLTNGYNKKRSGDIQIVLDPAWIDGGKTGTTHGLWYPYDAHIPMLWMGWGIKQGTSNRTMYMTDIAPTLAALLHIQEPNGNLGQVMTEVLKW
ncbi:MAG: alkaline phosphatase family protein, partial [Dinghuibacter sp.]|nr:alkaline phosphatase family protein [Dinghuibacter sp.]